MITVHPSYKRKRNRPVRERALILAAGKLFAAQGYEATRTREIAALAGCAEGLIHRYFKGKAGLLLALIRRRVSKEVMDLNELSLAPTAADEVIQLVNWEVQRMWEDREFFRVIIPRALLDPSLGQMLTRIGPLHRAQAISERLKNFSDCHLLPAHELDGLAQFVSVIGFMFGFMRPVVLGQDREDARRTAATIAGILARGFPVVPLPLNDSLEYAKI